LELRRGRKIGSEKIKHWNPPRKTWKWKIKHWNSAKEKKLGGGKFFLFLFSFFFFPHDGPHVKRFWTALVTYNRRGDRESFEGFLNPLLYKKK
jgi:hypothetical protein